MDEFELTCNWISDSDKTLLCSVVCEAENNGIESITAETCICLIQNSENNNSCQRPELQIKSKYCFTKLNVYSEASLIEVFGAFNEYLYTCKAEFLDDWQGLAVYYASIKLPGITTCTLKFVRMKEMERLWIYNIQPTTKKLDSSNHKFFNVQNIINLLSTSLQKPEKPDNEKLTESLLESLCGCPTLKFQSSLNVSNKDYNIHDQDFKRGISNCYLKLGENSSNKTENEHLINYIDRKFIEMKAELMKEMETNLAQIRTETDEKLDKIMKLIESSKM